MAVTGFFWGLDMLYRLFGAFAILSASATMPSQAQNAEEIVAADKGVTSEQGRPAQWYLEQHNRLASAIAALKPQNPGTVDAYILVAGLDGDAVFRSESEETAKVLARRYNAEGRTILLTTDSRNGAAQGSPANINTALAAIAEKMDLAEDVLILYTTSHGNKKIGIVYQDGRQGFGMIAPSRMAKMLSDLGIKRRLIMISACYSGEFIPDLKSDDSIIITAASSMRPSFGCAPGNDWTFFGDALVNHGLRTPKPLTEITGDMQHIIGGWEKEFDLTPSEPQLSFGAKSEEWLAALEAQLPKNATPKTGTPSIESAYFLELRAEKGKKK
ncbi:C13 family peptidase [Sphingorhabdus arenilitoris]|uniref:C13 family peptidase n=1 Tax=Sphingorhabdus arenilitoris TaxID=1490041 RepID=A0ABV8RHJ3_9SPHN